MASIPGILPGLKLFFGKKMDALGPVQSIRTKQLDLAYYRQGQQGSIPIVLLHGFPYDPQSFAQVTENLVGNGRDVIVPYLRGYGPTRFLNDQILRSGQQASLGLDLYELLNALEIPKAIVAGYDWGGRAACIVAALWPEKVHGLVSCGGYNIQNIAGSALPANPEDEHKYWYQYYFHGERGRAGLTANRYELGRLLWQLWSPQWQFDEHTYQQSARAFENPDFVDVVIHSYRHRFDLVAGDPYAEPIEQRLAQLPDIDVPTVIVDGLADNVMPANGYGSGDAKFTQLVQKIQIESVGHNPPQEAPAEFTRALELVM